jgi:hypothetical protein
VTKERHCAGIRLGPADNSADRRAEADKVRGMMNSQIVWSFAETLSAAPQAYSLRCDDAEFVVFCFKKPEDADAFCERFGGERLPHPFHRNESML